MVIKSKWFDEQERIQSTYNSGATLEIIAAEYNVSRERMRQVFCKLGIQTRKKGWKIPLNKIHIRYTTLTQFLSDYRGDIGKGGAKYIKKFLPGLRCQECGLARNINMHHIVYPAKSLEDIQILCKSCHLTKHRKGMTYINQLDVVTLSDNGWTRKEIAQKYKVSLSTVSFIIRKIRNNLPISHFTKGSNKPVLER